MPAQTTTDYKKFGLLEFNRDVKKTRKLEKSMIEHGYITAYPLHCVVVNGKLKVKDGHHRLDVASKLGIPVAYEVCSDNATIQQLEETKIKWSINDYLTSYIRMGDPDYLFVKSFSESHEISTTSAINLLSGNLSLGGNANEKFKQGEFEVTHVEYAETVCSVLKTFRTAKFKQCSHANLLLSISRIIKAGHADLARLKKRIKQYSGITSPLNMSMHTVMDYIEELYNRGERGERVPLAFLTNETMRVKQAELCLPKNLKTQ